MFRFARGERWRKATSQEKRSGAGLFLLVAVLFIVTELATHFGRAQLGFVMRATPLQLWLWMTLLIAVMVFGMAFWARHVCARTSSILAVIAWAVLISLVVYFEWL